MELELEKRKIDCLALVLDSCINHEEHTDYIVPDASPDVLKILGAFGNAYIKEKAAREGKVTVSGVVEGWVLYVSEGDMAVRKIEVSIPFSQVFEGDDVTPDSKVMAYAKLASMEAREINPRKINVRVDIALCAQAYQPQSMEIAHDISDAKEYQIEKKCAVYHISAPIAMQSKSFTVADDLEIPSGKPAFSSLLRHDVALMTGETKIIGNKAVVKGAARIKCLYMTPENEIASLEGELPYSQIIDVDGMDETCDLKVKMELRGAEITPQPDLSGDVTALMVSLPIEAYAIAHNQAEVESIQDAYSTHYPVDLRMGEKKVPQRAEHMNKRIAMTETITCEMPVKQILDLSILLDPGRRYREEGAEAWMNTVLICVLYIGEDDTVSCATRKVTAICPMPEGDGNNYRAEAMVQGENYNVGMGNEIVVRFYIDYDIVGMSECAIPTAELILVDTENTMDGAETPSVIVKYVTGNESLWELAKRYRTTMDEILAANDLEEDEVRAGSMVLIPKKR